MTGDRVEERAHRILRAALADVAPEADADRLEPERTFHDQLDLDSVDFLRLMAALERHSGVRIPGSEGHRLATPAACRRYLRDRLA